MGKRFSVPKHLKGGDLEDYILANHPYFVRRWAKARREIAQGKFVGEKELRELGEKKDK